MLCTDSCVVPIDWSTAPIDRPTRLRAQQALDCWEAELERGVASGCSWRPVIAALVDAGRRDDLPLAELSVYMDSMRFGLHAVRMANRAELDHYIVAAPAPSG